MRFRPAGGRAGFPSAFIIGDDDTKVNLEFRGSIISDGLVVPYQIYFCKSARADFKDAYMNAKKNQTIRSTIKRMKQRHPRVKTPGCLLIYGAGLLRDHR